MNFLIHVEWVSVATASKLLEIEPHSFYTQIRLAKNFPHKSPFKRGNSWRQISSKKLQINPSIWLESIAKL
jgi:hypothetical protein